jgi:hypothetical protein
MGQKFVRLKKQAQTQLKDQAAPFRHSVVGPLGGQESFMKTTDASPVAKKRMRWWIPATIISLDQFPDGPGNLLDRHVGIDAVLIEEVDSVRPHAFERLVGHKPNSFRSAIQPGAGIAIFEREFRGNDHFVANRRERVANQRFVRFSVRLCGVE